LGDEQQSYGPVFKDILEVNTKKIVFGDEAKKVYSTTFEVKGVKNNIDVVE
tara:strand:- start:1951 stop:2103 length:153 start_codon:yes stop_codon:yes gene_type:complete